KRILSHESQARQLTAARAYLDRHAHDAYLGKALTGVAMQRESLLAISKKRSQTTTDIATAEAAVKRARASLDAQKSGQQENEQLRGWMQAALGRQAQALETLLNGRLLRELHNEKDGLLRERLLLKKIHDLHEERSHLQSGQPCPLCGATEHPFARHELPHADEMDVRIAHLETRIEQAHACQDRIEQCKADLEAAMNKVVASEQQLIMSRYHVEQVQSVLTNLQHDHQQHQEAAHEVRKALSDLLAPFGVALPDDDMATLVVDQLEKRAQQWKHSVDTENRLAGQQVAADQEISRLEKMLAQLDEQLGQAQQVSTAHQHD